MAPTLYVYAARPRHADLYEYNYVGYAITSNASGPIQAFARALHSLKRGHPSTGRRLAELFPAASHWDIRLLETDEDFLGSKADMEQRRLFYMYWVQHHERLRLINRRMPLASNPTWPRTWSVIDGGMML